MSPRTHDRFRPKGVALGLFGFASLAALGALTAGWLDTGPSAIVSATRAVPARLIAAGLALLLVDFLLGGLRLHLWVRRLQPGVAYRTSLRTYLVNLFAAAVSPMGAASGPAQFATLVRGGVRPARAVAALLFTYVGVLGAFLLLGGLAGIYLLTTTSFGDKLGGLERGILAGAGTSATLLVVAILNPRAGGVVATGATSAGIRMGGRPGRLLHRLGVRLQQAVADYRAALRSVRRDWQMPLFGGVGLSTAMLLNKCVIGFIVAAALGFTGGYLDFAARHALQSIFIYFSPTPGGSGLAEASVPTFMAGVVPEGRSMEYAFLWRAMTSYVGVAVGAIAFGTVFGHKRSASTDTTEIRRTLDPYWATEPARSVRYDRCPSTQATLPNSAGTKSGFGTDPG